MTIKTPRPDPMPFLVQAILDRLSDRLDPETLQAIGLCMRLIETRDDAIQAVHAALSTAILKGGLDAMDTSRAIQTAGRLEKAAQARLPVPPPADILAPASTTVWIAIEQARVPEEGAESDWKVVAYETAPDQADEAEQIIDKYKRIDEGLSSGTQREYRLVEITTTNEPVDPEAAPTGESGDYRIEGYYGDCNDGRKWAVWQAADGHRQAIRALKRFQRGLNPRDTCTSSPTWARLRRVVETRRMMTPV